MVIDEINKFNFNVVIDVGCGLGNIIKRINAPYRVGIDIDKNIIKAAKSSMSNSSCESL